MLAQVHSSQHIKRRVLDDGALQPVIGLLSSKCHESQREAALLLGQFATAEPDYKAKIVQRGAVPPLIVMLRAPDAALKEMAAFALGRLAQNQDNQVRHPRTFSCMQHFSMKLHNICQYRLMGTGAQLPDQRLCSPDIARSSLTTLNPCISGDPIMS